MLINLFPFYVTASPANAEASQLYERDRREYNKRVKKVVEESWIDDSDNIDENNEDNTAEDDA